MKGQQIRKNIMVGFFRALVRLVTLFDRASAQEMSRICLAPSQRFKGLGDNLICNSVIRLIRQRFPNARISLLIPEVSQTEFLKQFYLKHSWIDEVLVYPSNVKRWIPFILRMRCRRFELLISHQNDVRTLFLLSLCGIPERIGDKESHRESWKEDIFLTQVVAKLRRHWTDDAMAYASEFGLNVQRKTLPAIRFWPEASPEKTAPHPIVAVHPGGSQCVLTSRRWPLERFQYVCLSLVRDFRASIFLVGGTEEYAEQEVIRSGVHDLYPNAVIYNLCGSTINQTLNLLYAADLFIGNDSAPMHMAVAVGTPVIAIFGPSPQSVFGPQHVDSKHTVITKNDQLQLCNQCTAYACAQQAHCFTPKCLANITAEEAWGVIQRRLRELLITNRDMPQFSS